MNGRRVCAGRRSGDIENFRTSWPSSSPDIARSDRARLAPTPGRRRGPTPAEPPRRATRRRAQSVELSLFRSTQPLFGGRGCAVRSAAARQRKKPSPRMGILRPIRRCQRGLRIRKAPVAGLDPAAYMEPSLWRDIMPQPHPKLHRQRLDPRRHHCLRHRLIQHGAHNAAMHDTAKAFPLAVRSPFRNHGAAAGPREAQMQPPRVLISAGKAGGIRARTQGFSFDCCTALAFWRGLPLFRALSGGRKITRCILHLCHTTTVTP